LRSHPDRAATKLALLADHKPFTPKVLAQDRRDHASSKPAAVRKLDHRTTRLTTRARARVGAITTIVGEFSTFIDRDLP
jgi:hypothetical protein